MYKNVKYCSGSVRYLGHLYIKYMLGSYVISFYVTVEKNYFIIITLFLVYTSFLIPLIIIKLLNFIQRVDSLMF